MGQGFIQSYFALPLDSTRRRKVCALNAIGMWFKYHIHLKRYFGMKETEVLIGRGIRAQAKKDIVSIVKAKLLETRMYRSINEWRKIKNGTFNDSIGVI